MLLPYRVKNPTQHFPYATVALIALNAVAYLATSDLVEIREGVILSYGFIWHRSSSFTLITSLFLHGDIFHILGNMLYLWVFGPPVEDRLHIPRYLLLYFAAGVAGSLLQGSLDALAGEPRPVIGASGAIMGLLGAYWYLFSWSTVCVFYWFGWFIRGVWEVAAVWVIGIYLLLDLVQGLLAGSGSGVAYFAHVGGGGAGLLLCLALRAKRDTAEVSEAKALQADMGDLSEVPLHALSAMAAEEPGNPRILRAMVKPSVSLGTRSELDAAMAQAGPALIEKDAELVAYYLIGLRGSARPYLPPHLLRLAGMMERAGRVEYTLGLYRLIPEFYPQSPEVEMALYRAATLLWDRFHDAEGARNSLRELAQRFPKGEMFPYARELWNRIGQ